MTTSGGANQDGVRFEFDYLAGTYTKFIDLEAKNLGSYPMYTTLVEVNCIAPYIIPSGPTSFCRGGSVTLNSGSVGSSYQWNRNGNLIPGANSSSLLVTNPGKYTVTVTDSNCVSTLTSNVVRVKVPCLPPFDPQEKVSASEMYSESTALYSYYESSNQNLIIWADNLKGKTYQISIFNSTGKLLVTEKGNLSNGELDHQIDCSAFASGLYIVKLSTNTEQFTKKFVKGN
ncbi:MAG: T9SS type A sorting domain-containing protein [Bacteroidetes bacterium]|nr:T9SS type A sorting domain-containing protein [Bacteroidota bacterium]